jgi:BlaI family transcriptional regulator, penicillinase repressor
VAGKVFQSLNPTELGVMQILWADGCSTVREVYDELRQFRPIAYTTVQTAMERLAEQGMLSHQGGKRLPAYTYSVVRSNRP